MFPHKRINDSVHWFMNGLTSRIVAETGIPTDRHHLGKLLMQSFKDDPDFIMQIDGGTGEEETSGSALKRTVICAISLKNFGMKKGDVMVIMAPNHLDVAIPFYAALYLGVTIGAIDRNMGIKELQKMFEIQRPKIIFCQSEKAPDIQIALNEIELDACIVTFDKGDYLCSFPDFLDKYGDDNEIEGFKPSDFDPEETIALLIATSGTTGAPKAAAVTQKNLAVTSPYLWVRYSEFPRPTRMSLITSPLQWLTGLINFIISPVLRYTRLQTSKPISRDHTYYLINTYKPTHTVLSPTLMATLIRPGERESCDFSCFDQILLGGSAVSVDLVNEIKKITPRTEVYDVYGMTEVTNVGLQSDVPLPGSCGRPIGCLQYRLISVDTNDDIYEPNVSGELWLKGPGIFKEYYNDSKATEEAFADGCWFKTGDLFYRDENYNFYYVDRIKMLLKYNRNHISPVEIEHVIRQHPDVLDVAVTGIPDLECGDLPVACVVARPNSKVTAQDIKDLVKETLSDPKQLRGGVVFLDKMPLTSSTKVHRIKLKEMILNMKRKI